MSAGARIGAFVALLAAIFAGSALLGGALDPDGGGDGGGGHGAAPPGHEAERAAAAPGADHGDRGRAADGHAARPGAGTQTGSGARDALPAGLASAQDGYRLVAERTRFAERRAAVLRFRVLDAGGVVVRAFETEQARRMHLIVVRRDLRRYQHLHPAQGSDGAWTTGLTLPAAGVYRAFADFRAGGAQHTLGIDLFVPGRFDPLELPPASGIARVDGYAVGLRHGGGADNEVRFTVRRAGRAVADLQPYLGARGHLVMLRDGDLAYRHVHPIDSEPGTIAFDTGASEAGTYRLFLQFRHRGRVRTAAFTRNVSR